MLQVIVGLKQGVTGEELHKDAADTPYIAGKAPAQVQNDFRSAIMPSANDGTMVFVIKGCGAKVDQADVGIKEDPALFGRSLGQGRGSGNVPAVGECLVVVIDQENVFRFEICMHELQIMQEGYARE